VSREESLMEHISTHSALLRKMRLCYKIDERQIISNPSVLEDMLIRIIGRNAAEHVLTYVKDEIKTSILYNNP
jgi:hypothetical protein